MARRHPEGKGVGPATRRAHVRRSRAGARRLEGVHRLIGSLLYGTGLRIMEAMRLRIKDVDFSRREIIVRDGKGNKDRVTMLPVRLLAPLRDQIVHARELHRGDLANGFGAVWLPHALDRA